MWWVEEGGGGGGINTPSFAYNIQPFLSKNWESILGVVGGNYAMASPCLQ